MKKLVSFNTGNISRIGKNAFKNIHKKPSLYVSKGVANKYVKKLVKLLLNGGITKIKQKILE